MKLLKQKVTFFFTITQLNVNTGSHPPITIGAPSNYYQEQEFSETLPVTNGANGDSFIAAVNSLNSCGTKFIAYANNSSFIIPYTGYYRLKAHFELYNNQSGTSYPTIMLVTYDPSWNYTIQSLKRVTLPAGNGTRIQYDLNAPNTQLAITQNAAYTFSGNLGAGEYAPTNGASQQKNVLGTTDQTITGGVFLVAGSSVQAQMTDSTNPSCQGGSTQAYVLISGYVSIAATQWGNSGTQ
jgi:hypothetical protein